MFFDKRAQQVHIVAGPELGDGLLTAPGMAVEAHMTIVVVLGVCHALFDCIEVNVQAESLTDLVTDFGRRGIGTDESETSIEEDGADRLWLFKGHEYLYVWVDSISR